MKNVFILTTLICLSFGQLVSQTKRRTCGTSEHHNLLLKTRPEYGKELEKYKTRIEKYIEDKKSMKSSALSSVNITVPVVIHILYNNSAENISDNQALSQLTVLNNDFQKLNADTALIPSLFKTVASGVNVNFCLAQRDPNGNPTNGILHVYTPNASFGTDDKVKKTAQGGDDAWDVSRYMNVWICDLGNSLLGYGEFPTASYSNTYGLVINYTCTGTMGTAQSPFDKGRTGTHEFGHCFNLEHIWGDDFGTCFGSDNCSDTPNQKGENYGTPSFPQGTAATGGCCNASDTSSMFMNYMDYTDDAGMFMFSYEQCQRMLAVLNNPPYNSLLTSNGCTPVVLLSDDAASTAIIQPSGNSCNTTINPIVKIKNWGSNTLSSAVINYQLDNGTVMTQNFNGSLASLADTNIVLPSMIVSVGAHVFKAYTTLPNGIVDQNSVNDTSFSQFNIISGGQALPFSEGFEGTTFVPAGWSLNNPDAGVTWERTTAAAKNGVASARIDNYNDDFTGEIDEITTPALDLTSVTSPALSFNVAYKLYTNPASNPNYSDTLNVLISTDCGATWSSIYKKFGVALTTTSPTYANSAFIPTSNQWRYEVISLSSFSNTPNALLKFRNSSQYENYLYLDNINISSFTGI
ncbi:MAG: M43 family zinc metalloprotease, partial [Bacteroidota bacterium]